MAEHADSGSSRTKARTLLGFDYGLERIGVAVGQELTGTATALITVRANDGKPDWDAISRLFEEWQPDDVVIGLPLNMDGSESELSRSPVSSAACSSARPSWESRISWCKNACRRCRRNLSCAASRPK